MLLSAAATCKEQKRGRPEQAGAGRTSYRLIFAISSSIWCCAAMPPPSWVSPRSAMDTADDSRELTDGRRTNCGPAERDEDRDWKFMAPRASRLGIVYRRGIWWSKIGVGSRMVDLCSTCRVESLSVTSTEYRSRWCRSKADVPSGQAEEGAGSAAVLAGLGLLRQAMGRLAAHSRVSWAPVGLSKLPSHLFGAASHSARPLDVD